MLVWAVLAGAMLAAKYGVYRSLAACGQSTLLLCSVHSETVPGSQQHDDRCGQAAAVAGAPAAGGGLRTAPQTEQASTGRHQIWHACCQRGMVSETRTACASQRHP